MPLPKGFKVDGSVPGAQGSKLVPPRVKKIMASLDVLPFGELLTSTELGQRVNLSFGGAWTAHPAVIDYRQKVDGKLFGGSRKSIANLRKQLQENEESDGEN
jgi:hypothetical protein